MLLAAASFSAILLRPAPPADQGHMACPAAIAAIHSQDEEAYTTLARLGNEAVQAVDDVMGEQPLDTANAQRVLDLLSQIGDARNDQAVRPYLFADNPALAAAAIRTLWMIGGTRAVPTLEFLLRTAPPFPQAQATLEGLREYALPSSFPTLATYAENPANDPELRAMAAQTLASLDLKQARRWFQGFDLPAGSSPFLAAEIEVLANSLDADRRRR